MPVLAVGAAFDYHAKLVAEPPMWIQRRGLQCLYRLLQNPRRLWHRYLVLNPRFVAGVVCQSLRGPRRDDTVEPEWVGWA